MKNERGAGVRIEPNKGFCSPLFQWPNSKPLILLRLDSGKPDLPPFARSIRSLLERDEFPSSKGLGRGLRGVSPLTFEIFPGTLLAVKLLSCPEIQPIKVP